MDRQDKYALIFVGGTLVIGAAVGSLSGLWLSSRVLSPLIAGGVLGSVIPALYLTLVTLSLLKDLYEGNSERGDSKFMAFAVAFIATSGLIGVDLGFAANAIFPGVMLAMGSPALVGAVIGTIAPIAALLAAAYVTVPLAEKVDKYIMSPIVEWVSSGKREVS